MNHKEEKISLMILDYLRKNPEAGDTLEGITKWWLELEKIEHSVDEVANVLGGLMEVGIIKMYESGSGAIFYKINEKNEHKT